jgi:phytol kinase
MNDLWALVLSFVYVGFVLGINEAAHRWGGVSSFVTRKLVHAAVGTWVLPTLFLFETWQWAIVPPVVSLLVNAVAMRRRAFRSIEGDDPKNCGPLFFPVAFVVLLPLCWASHLKFAAGAGILCMAWGDPLASVVGRALGRHRYKVMGASRSLEGSVVMFCVSFLAAAFATHLLSEFSNFGLFALAICAAVVAAAVEAVSAWGSDDLTVPLAVSAALALIAGRLT